MKKIFVMLCLMFSIYSASFAMDFNLSWLSDVFKSKLVAVHFGNAGNDIKGFMLITETKKLITPEVISFGGNNLKCNYQLRGYYYNPGHGENNIYVLDKTTYDAWNGSLGYTMDGGFYLGCDGGDPNAVYGKITYKIGSTVLYQLLAGLKYNSENNNIENDLSSNLEYGTVPGVIMAGLIYDTMYGIGFVGGIVNRGFSQIVSNLSTNKVSDIFKSNLVNNIGAYITIPFDSLANSSISVNGLANLASRSYNKSITSKFQKGLLNQGGHQTVLSLKLVTMSNVLNRLRKNAYILCRGRWQDIDDVNLSYAGEVVCIKPSNDVVKISSNLASTGKGTTIIVKGNGVKLVVEKSQVGAGYVNLFVDNGYVVFSNLMGLVKIDGKGNYNINNYVTSGAYFRGDVMVNGIIAGGYNNGNLSTFEHKLYIQGRLISLNTIGDNISRNNFVKSLLGINVSDYVNLLSSFIWTCNEDGKGLDGVDCSNQSDKYRFNSIILQSTRYDDLLIR